MLTGQGSNSCDMVQRVEVSLSQKARVQVQVLCLAMEPSIFSVSTFVSQRKIPCTHLIWEL